MKKSLFVFAFLALSMASAFDDLSMRLQDLLCGVVTMLKDIFPMVLLAAFVLAAVIYGIAQMLPQEIKARAQSWAWHSIIFTIVAAILFYVIPYIIQALVPDWDLIDMCG